MNIKPILFNTDMVRAILAGKKTMTRRVLRTPSEITPIPTFGGNYRVSMMENIFAKPPYRPGDVMYVRETFWNYPSGYEYKADYDENPGYIWSPSIHMPKEAARIFLRVTSIKVERLQDITPGGIRAEGIEFDVDRPVPSWKQFVDVWDSTIKPKDRALYGWDANPWVWVIGFERISKDDAFSSEF